MTISISILIFAIIFAVIHFIAFRPRFVDFGDMCNRYREKLNKGILLLESRGIPYTDNVRYLHRRFALVITTIIYFIFISFYVISGIWFSELWFWIIVITQVVTTLISIYFTFKRHKFGVEITDWEPEFIDSKDYKFLFNFLVDILYYSILIFFAIHRIFS